MKTLVSHNFQNFMHLNLIKLFHFLLRLKNELGTFKIKSRSIRYRNIRTYFDLEREKERENVFYCPFYFLKKIYSRRII